jgi:hypothetical protein
VSDLHLQDVLFFLSKLLTVFENSFVAGISLEHIYLIKQTLNMKVFQRKFTDVNIVYRTVIALQFCIGMKLGTPS